MLDYPAKLFFNISSGWKLVFIVNFVLFLTLRVYNGFWTDGHHGSSLMVTGVWAFDRVVFKQRIRCGFMTRYESNMNILLRTRFKLKLFF